MDFDRIMQCKLGRSLPHPFFHWARTSLFSLAFLEDGAPPLHTEKETAYFPVCHPFEMSFHMIDKGSSTATSTCILQ
jgi:hypothetical protein